MQTQHVLHFFLQFFIKHKYKFFSASLLNIGWAFAEAYGPYTLKLLIDTFENATPADPASVQAIWVTVGLMIGVLFAKHTLGRVFDIITQGYVMPSVKADIRSTLFSYTTHHSYDYFRRNLSGTIAHKINQVANSFEELYAGVEHAILPTLISFVISIALIYSRHPLIAIAICGWMGLVIGGNVFLSGPGIKYSEAHAKIYNLLVGTVVNMLQNVLAIKLFVQQPQEKVILQTLQQEEIKCMRRLEWFLFTVRSITSVTGIIMLVGIVYGLVQGWHEQALSVGDIIFILTTFFNMMGVVWWVSSHIARLYKYYGVAREAYTLVTEPYDVIDVQNAPSLSVPQGVVEFENITFGYPSEAEHILFHNLSLRINAGEKVGVVGYSGSGKTTFVHLLMRFYDVQSGAIYIDGVNIHTVSQDSLRQNIALIPQDPLLFSRTIAENIAYGKPGATHQDVIEAAQKAHIHDFIMSLPQGYQTIVSERGTSLSGGQRQRIAIARAIVKDAPILILDEATSALDTVTERKIQESFRILMEGRTTIAIAHRLSTLQGMDRILVFEKGAIVEEGTHEALLQKGGYYARLWSMQVGGIIPDTVPDEK